MNLSGCSPCRMSGLQHWSVTCLVLCGQPGMHTVGAASPCLPKLRQTSRCSASSTAGFSSLHPAPGVLFSENSHGITFFPATSSKLKEKKNILGYLIFLLYFILSSIRTLDNVILKNNRQGLPWWRSGWESACQCRAHGFKPWSGKIPHAAERLSPWATIAEPARLERVLRNGRGHDSERPAHRDEEWSPLATTRESPHTETKTQHSHK